MFALNTGSWIAVALLVPFWWGMGLLVVALLGDVSPWWRVRATGLFDRLEGTHSGSTQRAALPSRRAA
jgi:hypothetical protein